MSTQSLQYGITPGTLKWIQGFQASRDKDNKWTGSEAFKCLKADLTRLIPQKGAPCAYPGFSFMTCSEVEVENLPGSYDQVTVKYGGAGEEGDFEFDDPDIDDPEFNKYNYALDITVSQEPIESHPKFREISSAERTILYNLIKGNIQRTNKPYQFTEVGTPEESTLTPALTGDEAKHLADYVVNGVSTFQRARQRWSCSFISPALPNANTLNYVGFITSAKGAMPLGDQRNWLFDGVTAQTDNGICNITYTWSMSETGGWDPYIYTKPA